MTESIGRNDRPENRDLLQYNPGIDGLRAIAALSVFVFHFSRYILPGGFVGVDIFFVISGYLITLVLLRDHEIDNFSVAKFYQRRIARIAPAFFVTIFVTLAAASVIYSAQDFASLGSSSAFASLSIVNMKLIFQGNYFTISPDSQPLLHYWTLSVEEQFYFLYPVYLYLITKNVRLRIPITATLTLLGFLTSIFVTYVYPTFAFYSLPTRAWELLAGCLVALIKWRDPAALRGGRAIGWIGLIAIALSMVLIDEKSQFPGFIVALPVLGTVGILSTISDIDSDVRKALSNSVMCFIGLRSYSIYLWHWPIFSLCDYQLYDSSAIFRESVKVSLTIVVSFLSYELVERPSRKLLSSPGNRWLAFGSFALAVSATCLIGFQVRASQFPVVSPDTILKGGYEIRGGDRTSVTVIGDSQAGMYARMLSELAGERQFRLNLLGAADGYQLPGEPRSRWPEVHAYLVKARPSVVVIGQAWTWKMDNRASALTKALADIHALGARAIILLQPPALPAGATRSGIMNGAREPFFEPLEQRLRRERVNTLISHLAGPRTIIVDPAPIFLRADKSIALRNGGAHFFYQDEGHLTALGTEKLKVVFAKAIEKSLQSQ